MALITLTEAKTYLQLSTTASDSLVTLYLDLISSEIAAYCNSNLEQTYYQGEVLEFTGSTFDGNPESSLLSLYNGQPAIALKNRPVVTASVAITYNGDAVDSTDYIVDSKTGIVTFYEAVGDYKKRLKASYTAGYTSATGSATSTPNDLKFVVLDGVKRLFESNTAAVAGAGNIESKRIKDFSVTYVAGANSNVAGASSGTIAKTYLMANKQILDRYVNISI